MLTTNFLNFNLTCAKLSFKLIKRIFYFTEEKNEEKFETEWGGVIPSIFLATAIMAGAGCSQPNGGNGDAYYEEPDITVKPDVGDPDYYIDEEFGGQKFVNVDYNSWYFQDQTTKNQEFTTDYQNAKKFINKKVVELQKDIAGETDNEFYAMIDTALNEYHADDANIADNIRANYKALAPIFYNFQQGNMLDDDAFYAYHASYCKLAHKAYQNSLSDVSKSTEFSVNKDMMTNIYPNNFFSGVLADANLSYDTLTVDYAKEIMNNTLSTIADKTNTSPAVLKKVVELALYNESLCGLKDIAKSVKVNSQNFGQNHNISDLYVYVSNYSFTQTIDDRTM